MKRPQHNAGRETQELQGYSDIAEAVSPILHEVGNLLNTMVLEASSLELRAPADMRPGFRIIRQAARQLVSLLNQFADYRSRKSPRPYAVDLNAVLREVAKSLDAEPARLELNLAPGPLLTAGAAVQLQILVRLLLSNALRATAAGQGVVTVHTEQQAEHVQLTVADQGPGLPEAQTGMALPPVREGEDVFELASCQSIVRHMRGQWEATNRPDGTGVVTVVQLPNSPAAPTT